MLRRTLKYLIPSVALVWVINSCTETKADPRSALLVVTGNVHSRLDPCG